MNTNLNLNTNSLSDLIVQLEKDNLELNDLIISTNNAIRKLDDSRWKSREKEQFMNQVLPFFTKIENNFYNSLNECVTLLKEANTAYQTIDTNVTKTVEDVDSSTIIDIVK